MLSAISGSGMSSIRITAMRAVDPSSASSIRRSSRRGASAGAADQHDAHGGAQRRPDDPQGVPRGRGSGSFLVSGRLSVIVATRPFSSKVAAAESIAPRCRMRR